ncbi:MAG: PilW family protein [Gammaproteobacteria bacterium]|nr:PilW family protein [Gammaproteobacteria bacterium]
MNAQAHSMKPSRQYGVTLVELLISMVIGLLLVGGVLQIFSSARQTYRVHDATSRMQEGGRMALEVLARDIRMADFWGCASNSINLVNNLDTSGTGYVDFVTGGIVGTDGGGMVPDSITLRSGVDSGIAIEPPYGPQASANIKVNVGNGLAEDAIVMVSDCTNGDVFQISNANPNGTGTLVHNTGTGAPGNRNVTNPGCPGGGNAHCLSKVYGGDAKVLLTQEIIYSIGTGSEGEPALFRNGAEFVDGIENLQILYGEDTNGSGTPNYFVPEGQVTDMNAVVSVRIAIVTRSSDDFLTDGIAQNYSVHGTNVVAPDQRLRQVYTSTIAVRNRL